jgi:hypothetical protein
MAKSGCNHSFAVKFILQFSHRLHNESLRIPAYAGRTFVQRSASGRAGPACAIAPAPVALAGFASRGPQNYGGTIQCACCIKSGCKSRCCQFLNHLFQGEAKRFSDLQSYHAWPMCRLISWGSNGRSCSSSGRRQQLAPSPPGQPKVPFSKRFVHTQSAEPSQYRSRILFRRLLVNTKRCPLRTG